MSNVDPSAAAALDDELCDVVARAMGHAHVLHAMLADVDDVACGTQREDVCNARLLSTELVDALEHLRSVCQPIARMLQAEAKLMRMTIAETLRELTYDADDDSASDS